MQLRSGKIYSMSTSKSTITNPKLNPNVFVVTPPSFDNETGLSFSSFLQQYELAIEVNNWDETTRIKILPVFLSGVALEWWNMNSSSFSKLDWIAIKTKMKQAFQPLTSKQELIKEINRKQRFGESTLNYVYHQIHLMNQINSNMPEEEKLAYLLNGIQEDIVRDLKKLNVTNIDDLIKQIPLLDSLHKQYDVNSISNNKKRNNKNTSKFFSNKAIHSKNQEKSFSKSKSSFNRYQHKQNLHKKELFCRYCKKNGHVIDQCYKRAYVNSKRNGINNTNDNTKLTNEDASILSNVNAVKNYEPPKPHKLLTADVTVDNTTVPALLDTGSSCSLISKDYFDSLSFSSIVHPNSIQLSSANGRVVETSGHIYLEFAINEQYFNHPLILCKGLLHKIILGNDFMSKNNINIDYFKNQVNINNTSVCFHVNFSNPANQLSLVDDCSFSPKETKTIFLKSDIPIKLNTNRLDISPNSNFCSRYPIQFNSFTTQCNSNLVPVTLTNTSNKIIKIHRNTNIALTSKTDPPIESNSSFFNTINAIFDSNDFKKNLQHCHENSKVEDTVIQNLLNNYGIVALDPSNPGICKVGKHKIDLLNNIPISSTIYRTSPKEKEIIDEEIEKMLKNNIIEPSTSNFSSPIVLVSKKDGSKRFCVDYRNLNKITIKDNYPLPRIDDIIDSLNGSNYFSSLDLASGYWQIKIKESDKYKTAFISHAGLFQFNVMPFGLMNAPATFQRTMDNVFSKFKWKFVLVYLDDIIIYSKNKQDHVAHLKQVFNVLKENCFKLKLSKCKFFQEELLYLGYIINRNGILPNNERMQAIQNIPKPSNAKELQSFLGLLNYYRKWVKNFSIIAKPLYILLQKDIKFDWNSEHETAFATLKNSLLSPPLLKFPDYKKTFFIFCDACDIGIGAVLAQKYEGKDCAIAFISRTLNGAETRYSITEKECLSVVWSINQFKSYIYGTSFIVVTDHSCLQWLKSLKSPNNRLTRWSLKLSEYDYIVQYRKGSLNINADFLSRNPSYNVNNIEGSQINLKDIPKYQRKDPEIFKIIEKVRNDSKENTYFIEDDVLYKSYLHNSRIFKQIVLPKEFHLLVLDSLHKDLFAGHMGIRKTYLLLKERFYWKSMLQDVKDYVSSCPDCQSRKTPKNIQDGEIIPIISSQPFELVGMDICGPLVETKWGNKYILVIIDHFTKWPEAYPLKETTSANIAEILVTKFIARHGCPRKILTDQGANFISDFMKSIYKLFRIKKIQTTAYHPQGNGITERFNSTLINIISKYCNIYQNDWDKYLPFALMAYRSSINSTTKEKPYFLLYGRDPVLPLDVDFTNTPKSENSEIENYKKQLKFNIEKAKTVAKENISESHKKYFKFSNRNNPNPNYKVNDLMLLYDSATPQGMTGKLINRWKGIFIIKEKLSPVNYKIQSLINDQNKIVHSEKLKPLLLPKNNFLKEWLEEEIDKESKWTSEELKLLHKPKQDKTGKKFYEVEYIKYFKDIKIENKFERLFRIKWKNFDSSYDTFEPKSNLVKCEDAIVDFVLQRSRSSLKERDML